MRTIKFRGKRVDNGEWVCGYYSKASFGVGFSDAIIVFSGSSTMPYKVIPETVGQFTGIVDKDGIEVYEGDLIRLHTGKHVDEYVYKVIYTSGAAFCLTRVENDDENFICSKTPMCVIDNSLMDNGIFDKEMEDVIEVIGSIHYNEKKGE